MTNREKYFLKRDEYDILVSIIKTGMCPIELIGGCVDNNYCWLDRCADCIQDWLNREADSDFTKKSRDIKEMFT